MGPNCSLCHPGGATPPWSLWRFTVTGIIGIILIIFHSSKLIANWILQNIFQNIIDTSLTKSNIFYGAFPYYPGSWSWMKSSILGPKSVRKFDCLRQSRIFMTLLRLDAQVASSTPPAAPLADWWLSSGSSPGPVAWWMPHSTDRLVPSNCYFRHANCATRGMGHEAEWFKLNAEGMRSRTKDRRASDCSIYRALHNLWRPATPTPGSPPSLSPVFPALWLLLELRICMLPLTPAKGVTCLPLQWHPAPPPPNLKSSARSTPSLLLKKRKKKTLPSSLVSVFELCSFFVPGSFAVFRRGFPQIWYGELHGSIAWPFFKCLRHVHAKFSNVTQRGEAYTHTLIHTAREADNAITCANEVWCWPKCDSLCCFFVTISMSCSECVMNFNYWLSNWL